MKEGLEALSALPPLGSAVGKNAAPDKSGESGGDAPFDNDGLVLFDQCLADKGGFVDNVELIVEDFHPGEIATLRDHFGKKSDRVIPDAEIVLDRISGSVGVDHLDP